MLDDISRLSVDERIQLVEDIWDSIAADAGVLPLTDTQRAELDRRIDSPGEYVPWETVRTKLGTPDAVRSSNFGAKRK
jgi:putative addiction module component (TIGR02574 family)